jgi:aldehyde dehydrogenase (NAD+)
MLSPLFGAIAAGNCALLKPSELAPATSQVLAQLIAQVFDPGHVTVVEGGAEVAQALLAEKFDHIFFTGGERVGRIVMAAAAAHLTPVTLELGGKSPCVLDTNVDLDVAVRRIVWGKFLNAGQTCVAPDYLLVPEALKETVVKKLQERLEACFGSDPQNSPDYARIINSQQLDRLVALLNSGRILWGGSHDREQRFLAPTLMDEVDWDSPIMESEIFGPILPMLTYTDLDEVISQITRRPKPLAFYLFSRSVAVQERLLTQISAGSVCINDVILQVSLWDLPFGGVGSSGMGRYHGRYSFETFSHLKSVLKKPFWLDMDWRYPPYAEKIPLFRRFIGLR